MRKCKKRATDLIARYNDEEFMMILANNIAEQATEVVKTIQNSIESLEIQNEFLKINFGVASMIPSAESSAYNLVKKAENELLINNEQLTIIN